MNDAGSRRDHFEIFEDFLTPTKEIVTLKIPSNLFTRILFECSLITEVVDHD